MIDYAPLSNKRPIFTLQIYLTNNLISTALE